MKDIRSSIYRLVITFAAAVLLAACSVKEPVSGTDYDDAVEIEGIRPFMTRATGEELDVAELKDYVGRSTFSNNDRAVFTSIKRTSNSIQRFTYTDIEFVSAVATTGGVTSIGWSRDKDKGSIGGGNSDAHPDRIYWSDATNPHTFIGYCAPQQGEDNPAFDWGISNGVYYGSIGNPSATGIIDFRSTFSGGAETKSGNEELRKNDILLTYSTEITASDAIANIRFHHGLAQVRVIVNISDFAAGGGDDIKSVVSDMVLENMLTMYKWRQTSVEAEELTEGDVTALGSIYTSGAPAYNQRKSFNLWIPDPAGIGEKSSRTFTFYGLVVPTIITSAASLAFSFKVTYPDPMKPEEMKDHTYHANISSIHFDAGKCTTITISLNHKNEKMTVGAEYDDWEFVDIPDHSELKKNSTFLTTVDRTKVTILGDTKATVDDATWLYIDKTNPDYPVIRDIYGNPGTLSRPFVIKSAEQLLSLAYEVSGTGRINSTSVVYYTNFRHDDDPDAVDVDPVRHTLPEAGNFDFANYYISLDAGLYLQPSDENLTSEQELNWPGIGVFYAQNSTDNRPFNGRLMAGVRIIKKLKGRPLFGYIGPQGHIDQLILEDVISCTGSGAFVEVNEGVICASKVGSKLMDSKAFEIAGKTYAGGSAYSPSAVYAGAFCGVNDGALLACYSNAHINAPSADRVGGLVGLNNGLVLCSYAAGAIEAPETAQVYGIAAGLGQINYTTDESATPLTHEGTLTFCVYDSDIIKNTTTVRIEDEKTTDNQDIPDALKTHGCMYNTNEKRFDTLTGCRAVTTSYLQNKAIVGTKGDFTTTTAQLTLNGALAAWSAHPTAWPEYLHYVYNKLGVHSNTIIQMHLSERYYEYHVASYPWVY